MAKKKIKLTFDGGSTYDGSLDVNPSDRINIGVVLWCVYGPSCFPQVMCCKVIPSPREQYTPLTIWGYSVYRNSPGFRTLGIHFVKWMRDNPEAKFFRVRNEALAYLANLITPPDRLLE